MTRQNVSLPQFFDNLKVRQTKTTQLEVFFISKTLLLFHLKPEIFNVFRSCFWLFCLVAVNLVYVRSFLDCPVAHIKNEKWQNAPSQKSVKQIPSAFLLSKLP